MRYLFFCICCCAQENLIQFQISQNVFSECVCGYIRVCAHVCVRERERGRENVCVHFISSVCVRAHWEASNFRGISVI